MLMSRMGETGKLWFRRFLPRPDASLRLVCLPHAGGGASAYREWASLLPPTVELVAVQLPGREERLDEPLIDDMNVLVDVLAATIGSDLSPYVLFGHSMGAAIAFELCLALRRRRRPLPLHLIASGREAPRLSRGGTLHRDGEECLARELMRLDGAMAQVLAHPELRAMVMPIVANDYRLIETYMPSAMELPLSIPVSAFAADQDPELVPGDAEAWREVTDATFTLQRFSGGHFYFKRERDAVMNCLVSILNQYLPDRGGMIR